MGSKSSKKEDTSSSGGKNEKPCICPPVPTINDGRPNEGVSPEPGSSHNPSHWSSVKQLYSRTGYNIAIFPNGKVKGIKESFHKYAILEFSSVDVGEVRMKGRDSGRYLAMNKKGKLYGELEATEEGTVFVENYHNGWNTYLSRKYAHMGWYMGIKKSGKPKPGSKTEFGQKAVMFLPRSAEPD